MLIVFILDNKSIAKILILLDNLVSEGDPALLSFLCGFEYFVIQ